MEDMLLVAVERGHEVVTLEVAPADRALAPQATATFVLIVALLTELGLLMLELGGVKGGNDLRHRQWDRDQSTEHALHEERGVFFLLQLVHLLLELFHVKSSAIVFPLHVEVPTSHQIDPPLDNGTNEASTLNDDDEGDNVIEADEVREHRNDLEGGVERL